MKRSVWSTLVLGLWLMISPFVLVFVNRRVLGVLWEDLLLGFGIATFSLCRMLSRRTGEMVFADWLVGALGLLTLINPFLYSYANRRLPNGTIRSSAGSSSFWPCTRTGGTKRAKRTDGAMPLVEARED